jgi:hypothetical protein
MYEVKSRKLTNLSASASWLLFHISRDISDKQFRDIPTMMVEAWLVCNMEFGVLDA